MSASKTISRKRGSESVLKKSDSKKRVEDDLDTELSSDLKGIMSALQQIKQKAEMDGQKKNEMTISSVSSEIRSRMDELKSKLEKDRQTFAKAVSKNTKEFENRLKSETVKFQEVYDKLCKERDAHLGSLKDTLSKFEEDKEKLFMRFEQMRKKEKNLISEQEKFCADKLASLEESLKKKKQDDKTFSILKKTLGSFLGDASDEDFPADD